MFGTCGRSKPMPLSTDITALGTDHSEAIEDSKVQACRIFMYANMSMVSLSKPFQIATAKGLQDSASSVFALWSGAFAPRSLRQFFMRLEYPGLHKHNRLAALMAATLWDEEELGMAEAELEALPMDALQGYTESFIVSSDLNQNDARSRRSSRRSTTDTSSRFWKKRTYLMKGCGALGVMWSKPHVNFMYFLLIYVRNFLTIFMAYLGYICKDQLDWGP